MTRRARGPLQESRPILACATGSRSSTKHGRGASRSGPFAAGIGARAADRVELNLELDPHARNGEARHEPRRGGPDFAEGHAQRRPGRAKSRVGQDSADAHHFAHRRVGLRERSIDVALGLLGLRGHVA